MGDITYSSSTKDVSEESLRGFFHGWPNPPSADTLARLLNASTYRWLALESGSKRCVGYVTAMSDGVLFSVISTIEVLPSFQGRGIGKELMRRMVESLGEAYAVDLVCDPDVQPFYEKCGFQRCQAMVIRRYDLLASRKSE